MEIIRGHLYTILGFLLALLVIGRLMLEKRNPQQRVRLGDCDAVRAVAGRAAVFSLGGRKSHRLAGAKLQVNAFAAQLAGRPERCRRPPTWTQASRRPHAGNLPTIRSIC